MYVCVLVRAPMRTGFNSFPLPPNRHRPHTHTRTHRRARVGEAHMAVLVQDHRRPRVCVCRLNHQCISCGHQHYYHDAYVCAYVCVYIRLASAIVIFHPEQNVCGLRGACESVFNVCAYTPHTKKKQHRHTNPYEYAGRLAHTYTNAQADVR